MLREFVHGPCGLHCGACAVEDCMGCQKEVNDTYAKSCVIRICADKKGIIFCNECENCPCTEMHELVLINNQKIDRANLKTLL